MKKIIILSAILFSISCTSKSQETDHSKQEQKTTEKKQIVSNKETNGITVVDETYTLDVYIETSAENINYLVMTMNPSEGSYFISPLSKAGFKGSFKYGFGETKNIDFFGEVTETPSAFKHVNMSPYDNTIEEGRVYEKTVYKQALTVKSITDFETMGKVEFTIELRCTYEIIPFKITLENGVFKITEAKC